jgi:hypothetical protein
MANVETLTFVDSIFMFQINIKKSTWHFIGYHVIETKDACWTTVCPFWNLQLFPCEFYKMKFEFYRENMFLCRCVSCDVSSFRNVNAQYREDRQNYACMRHMGYHFFWWPSIPRLSHVLSRDHVLWRHVYVKHP